MARFKLSSIGDNKPERTAVSRPVERVYIDRVVEKQVPVETIVIKEQLVEKVVNVEVPVYVDREVVKEVIVEKEVIIERPVRCEVFVDREVLVDKPFTPKWVYYAFGLETLALLGMLWKMI